MALVAKNDVTQIFAIQAPSIDLPPTFANYPRGWDTARDNNGKPTIKQFNYIQQRTDQNLLWIHQNGAALPYDAAMEYAEGAVVLKDGDLQKKQGASWVSVSVKTDSELNTWSGRTQESKNKDSIHVLDFKIGKTDQQAIQDAVNYCVTNNRVLDWDGANLASTENIVDFWSVKHIGEGTITRNGYTHFITPRGTETNTIFVQQTYIANGDGIDPSCATTAGLAMAYLKNIGERSLDGNWVIKLQGVCTNINGIGLNDLPYFKNRLQIVGDDVATGAVPTTVWDGASIGASYAIRLNHSVIALRILLKNIKFINWKDGAGNRGALAVDTSCDIIEDNCHVEDCSVGFWHQHSYNRTINCSFKNIGTFAVSVAYNGYGNVGIGGAGNTFDNCDSCVSVARGAIAYVENNDFNNIKGSAIEINKNARARERNNRYNSFGTITSGRQCCILLEEGAILNNDNASGLPSTILAPITSDKPFLRTLAGAIFGQISTKTAEYLHSSFASNPAYTITDTALINLSDIVGDRILAIPAYSLFAEHFKIRFEILGSLSANTSFAFALYGQGSSGSLNMGTASVPALTETKNFKLTVSYVKNKGSDTVFCTAECPQFNYYSNLGLAPTVLSQPLVRDKSESLLIYRPCVTKTGAGSLLIYAINTYITVS